MTRSGYRPYLLARKFMARLGERNMSEGIGGTLGAGSHLVKLIRAEGESPRHYVFLGSSGDTFTHLEWRNGINYKVGLSYHIHIIPANYGYKITMDYTGGHHLKCNQSDRIVDSRPTYLEVRNLARDANVILTNLMAVSVREVE